MTAPHDIPAAPSHTLADTQAAGAASSTVMSLLAPRSTPHDPTLATPDDLDAPLVAAAEKSWLRHTVTPYASRALMTTSKPAPLVAASLDPSEHHELARGGETHFPRRHRRSRASGASTPQGTIFVGRGTLWGNPFKVVAAGGEDEWFVVDTGRFAAPLPGLWSRTGAAQLAVSAFAQTLDETYPAGSSGRTAFLDPLRGHDLSCWCPDQAPCHADLLIRLANPHLPDPRLLT